jgi:sugar lactone lactonase YvrE
MTGRLAARCPRPRPREIHVLKVPGENRMLGVQNLLPRGAAWAALLVLAAGCATTGGHPKDLPSWPPGDTPRIQFVRTIVSEADLKAGAWQTMVRTVIPASADAVVKTPTGLALSPDETILYVACYSGGAVLRADLAHGKIDVLGAKQGEKAGRPFGVAVDGNGNVFVSDMSQDAILVYAPDGKFLRVIRDGDIDKPGGLAIDRRRQLLYVVSGVHQASERHRVEVYSLAGAHLRTIGTRGERPGEFNFPTNLTVAKDGTLYVVDMLNFRVQLFDPEGGLVTTFGQIGAGLPGTFDKAKSVALDSFGNVYVVDSQAAHVQMFNPKFQVLMAFGGRLNRPGFFMTPTAITIDSKNTIYVAEFFGGWVGEYKLVNTSAADSFSDGSPPPAPAAAASAGK